MLQMVLVVVVLLVSVDVAVVESVEIFVEDEEEGEEEVASETPQHLYFRVSLDFVSGLKIIPLQALYHNRLIHYLSNVFICCIFHCLNTN